MMQITENRQTINIDKQQVLNSIGYCDDHKPSARIESLVNDYTENYPNLIESAYSYTIRDIESIQNNRVTFGESIILESKIIARLLQKCEKIAIFVLTIGNTLEEMAAYLAENGLVLQATVLDAIGSCATEQLAVSVEAVIREIARVKGFSISRRFSPGYCDWDVTQQEMIFRALNGNSAGVSLTEEYLMLPRKSISSIIGIGNSSIENYNPCETCLKQDCPGRREQECAKYAKQLAFGLI
ncbi:vitamin B12 dependent-methionine synthase activation domain-containing protein [Chloroflexota bacterium]